MVAMNPHEREPTSPSITAWQILQMFLMYGPSAGGTKTRSCKASIQLWTHNCGHVPHERAVTWILLTVPTLDIEVDVELRDNEEEEGEDIYI